MTESAEVVTTAPLCPVVSGKAFDPMDREQAGDQHRWLSVAQEQTPIFYMPDYDMWCVCRYDDVMRVIRDTENFSARDVVPNDLHPDLEDIFVSGHPMARALVVSDPPDHTRRRKALQPAFTPKAIAAYEPTVTRLAHELIDGLIERGGCDLASDFARKLALSTVTILCGLSPERGTEFDSLATFQLTASAGVATDSPGFRAEALRTKAFMDYLEELLERRRVDPKNDLISYLATVPERTGLEVTMEEMVSLLFNVFRAAIGNTVTGICVMFREILRRSLWHTVVDDHTHIEMIVEESLRWHAPAQAAMRITTKPITIAGQNLPAGAKVYAHYGAAQRDPRVFAHPDEFNPSRADIGMHFALGRGAHMCLGAPLARQEMQVSLRCFAERIPSLRLVTEEVSWTPSFFLGAPSMDELLLEWSVP